MLQGTRTKKAKEGKFIPNLTFMKEERKTMKMGSSCTVSCAGSTGFGLGSSTSVRPPPLEPNFKNIVEPRKIEI